MRGQGALGGARGHDKLGQIGGGGVVGAGMYPELKLKRRLLGGVVRGRREDAEGSLGAADDRQRTGAVVLAEGRGRKGEREEEAYGSVVRSEVSSNGCGVDWREVRLGAWGLGLALVPGWSRYGTGQSTERAESRAEQNTQHTAHTATQHWAYSTTQHTAHSTELTTHSQVTTQGTDIWRTQREGSPRWARTHSLASLHPLRNY